MSHTKEEELESAAGFLKEALAELKLPEWDDLEDINKKKVIKMINDKLDAKYDDHLRHFIFGVKYDITERLHLVAYPIAANVTVEDRVPGGQHVDEV